MEAKFCLFTESQKEMFSYKTPCEIKLLLSENPVYMCLFSSENSMLKLAEEYGLPYYKGITLDDLCMYFEMAKPKLLVIASELGDVRVVRFLTQPYKIVKHGLRKVDYNQAMAKAAEKGHIEIVKLMLELGADDYNRAMVKATQGGHEEIIKIILNASERVHMQKTKWSQPTAEEIKDIIDIELYKLGPRPDDPVDAAIYDKKMDNILAKYGNLGSDVFRETNRRFRGDLPATMKGFGAGSKGDESSTASYFASGDLRQPTAEEIKDIIDIELYKLGPRPDDPVDAAIYDKKMDNILAKYGNLGSDVFRETNRRFRRDLPAMMKGFGAGSKGDESSTASYFASGDLRFPPYERVRISGKGVKQDEVFSARQKTRNGRYI